MMLIAEYHEIIGFTVGVLCLICRFIAYWFKRATDKRATKHDSD